VRVQLPCMVQGDTGSNPMYRAMMGLIAAAFVAVGSGISAQATTIEFHDSSVGGPQYSGADYNCMKNTHTGCYGDRANGPTSALGSSYVPDGNTPNIAATYTGAPNQWNNGFGQSTYLGTIGSDPSYLTLKADSGFLIKLTSITLDIDHGFGASHTGTVDIFAGGIPGVGDTALQSLSITGAAPVTTALALLGGEFTIRLVSENFGLQKLSFDQVAATTPLPAGMLFFATGLGGIALTGWRRRKTVMAA